MIAGARRGRVATLERPTLEAAHGWALLPLAAFLLFAAQIGRIQAGEFPTLVLPWLPSLGVSLAFRLDGLSLLFALLVSGIGALVVLYSVTYLAGDAHRGRFTALMLLFTGAMLGLVLADDLIGLFLFWEATTVLSYLLVGYKHRSAAAREAARRALLVTAGGGLALLAGMLLLGTIAGGYRISEIAAAGPAGGHPLYAPALLLILAGAFTKSAQVPFHDWLPGAMAAPTPASAYLHSATMVKAGVYLLARLLPVLGGTALWLGVVTAVGAATMLYGALVAWRQTDLKRILAYSTISALGTLTMLLGLGTPLALKAALLVLVGHALYKAALFLVAGAIDTAAGTRDVGRLGGLHRTMPWSAAAAGLAGLSMAGLPPLTGFLGKEYLYEATLAAPAALWLTAAAVGANVLIVVAAALAAGRPFFGRPGLAGAAAEVPATMWLPPLLLAATGVALGLAAGWMGAVLLAPASAALLATPEPLSVKLWQGVTPMLLLSGLTLTLGGAAYVARDRLAVVAPVNGLPSPAPLAALLRLAAELTAWLQHGLLRRYLLVLVGALLLVAGGALVQAFPAAAPADLSPVRAPEAALALLVLVATGAAVGARSRLVALLAVGAAGYGIALLFALFGAPDLAMTQFAIETLTVLLLMLVLYRLPRFVVRSTTATRLRDGVMALLAGGLMTAFALAVLALPHPQRLTPYFAESSVPLARGRNVVNVILVDFRALDTLGEIVVLAAAALGVVALLRLRLDGPGPERAVSGAPSPPSLLLQTSAQALLPLLGLFAVFLLLRGHNEPGGGFVGGLVAAAALALVALARGGEPGRGPQGLIPAGLTLSTGAGLLGMAAGRPFLTGLWAEASLPVLGKLGTPFVFDVGVMLVVVGVVVTVLVSLMED